jgi:hypothetical protein
MELHDLRGVIRLPSNFKPTLWHELGRLLGELENINWVLKSELLIGERTYDTACPSVTLGLRNGSVLTIWAKQHRSTADLSSVVNFRLSSGGFDTAHLSQMQNADYLSDGSASTMLQNVDVAFDILRSVETILGLSEWL